MGTNDNILKSLSKYKEGIDNIAYDFICNFCNYANGLYTKTFYEDYGDIILGETFDSDDFSFESYYVYVNNMLITEDCESIDDDFKLIDKQITIGTTEEILSVVRKEIIEKFFKTHSRYCCVQASYGPKMIVDRTLGVSRVCADTDRISVNFYNNAFQIELFPEDSTAAYTFDNEITINKIKLKVRCKQTQHVEYETDDLDSAQLFIEMNP